MTISQRTAPIREKRSGAISAFAGDIATLAREAEGGELAQRVRTFSQDGSNDVQRALAVLRTIDGLGIVVHGPSGCAASAHSGAGVGGPWTVTGLNERDSIMGGDRKLRDALRHLHAAYRPDAIAVVATPVVAINNDDIESVVVEARDELGIPVFPVFTDGFRSKIAATGYDVAVHAVLKHVVRGRVRSPGDHVLLLSLSESDDDLAGLREFLLEAKIVSYPFPRFSRVVDADRIINARLSISIDRVECEYAGTCLWEELGIPQMDPRPPIGIGGTTQWCAVVAASLGREAEMARLVERSREELAPALDGLAAHAGARVYVSLPAATAFAVVDLIGELGLTPVGLGVTAVSARQVHHLQELASTHPTLPVLVGEGQVFEEVNLLHSLKPDLVISSGNAAAHGLRMGLPVLDLQSVPLLGFRGVGRVAEAIRRRLTNRALARSIAGEGGAGYRSGWLARSTHWYIKHEVK